MPKQDSLTLYISPSVCLSMVCSAMEVFPNECMGCVLGEKSKIVAAFPYQKAKRKLKEVMSESSMVFEYLFRHGKFKKLGDFHSHTYRHFERSEHCAPSFTDIEQLKVGGIEFIVQIRRKRDKASYVKCENGNVHVGWRQYRCTIVAFRRVKGFDMYGLLTYDRVKLRLKP